MNHTTRALPAHLPADPSDASLGLGHIWHNMACPAYRTLTPEHCTCPMTWMQWSDAVERMAGYDLGLLEYDETDDIPTCHDMHHMWMDGVDYRTCAAMFPTVTPS